MRVVAYCPVVADAQAAGRADAALNSVAGVTDYYVCVTASIISMDIDPKAVPTVRGSLEEAGIVAAAVSSLDCSGGG